MAVLSYISVMSATTPASSDSPVPPAGQMPTKVILPKKKPLKWSTGVAPGDYGGPPTTTKLRKYWGGEEADPLTSDEFIWNKDFVGRFKRMIEDPADDGSSLGPVSPVEEESSGFLSLNRVMSLDSMDVDLSKELTKPTKAIAREPVQSPTQRKGAASPKWRLAPTRREQEKWDRATKAATGGSVSQIALRRSIKNNRSVVSFDVRADVGYSSILFFPLLKDVMLREARQPRGDPAVLAAQSREQYFKLKKKLQILTLAIGGVGLVSAYVSYTPEIATSFGAGLVGSLIYIRMLGSTVDSMADGAKGLMKGAVGQPRLLVPVVLVMIYNRWNAILVPEYGTMHLELIPMLVGFFTYKIATFLQAIEEAISTVSQSKQT